MSLYNNCSHQNWRLLIELLEYLIMRAPQRWLEPWSIGMVSLTITARAMLPNGPGVKLVSELQQAYDQLGQEIMIKTHCAGRAPYTSATGFGHMHSIVNAYGLI